MRKIFPEKRIEEQYIVTQIQSIYDIFLNLDSINHLKKQKPHDEKGYFGGHGRPFKEREE